MDYLKVLYDIFITDKRYMYMVKGLGFSLCCTFFASVIGLVLGVLCAIMQLDNVELDLILVRQDESFIKKQFISLLNIIIKFFNILFKNKILAKIARIYVDLIRGTPAVVQLMILANIIFVGRLRDTPLMIIASLSFGINSGAYVAEIIRAGIQGLEKGQMEAARALGLPYLTAMKDIIIPQAIKKILPTLVSEFITLLKETSIVGFIGAVDLLRSANIITSLTYRGVEPLLAVGLIYLLLTTIFTRFMRKIERRMRESD